MVDEVAQIETNSLPQDQPQIDTAGTQPIAPISEQTANNRNNKYQVAFPNSISPGTSLDMLMNNREEELRKQAASQKDFDNTLRRQQVFSSIANKAGGLTLPDSLLVQDLLKKKQEDPSIVIEKNYAEQFTNELKRFAAENPMSQLATAMKEVPGYAAKQFTTADELKTKKEILNTLTEKATDAYEKQSWTGWAVDVMKGVTAGYGEVKMRGQVAGVPRLEGYLADNMRQQWSMLMAMPLDEFKEKAPAIVNKLIEDNPSMAALWTSVGQGLSNEDRMLINFLPVLDITLAGDVAKLGVSGYAKISAIRNINRVLRDAVKDAEPVASKAAVKETVGDIKGAAVDDWVENMRKLAGSLVDETGTAIRIPGEEVVRSPVVEGVASTVTHDIQTLMRSEELSVARDAVTPMGPTRPFRSYIVDQIQEFTARSFTNLNDAITKMMNVEQLPAALAIAKVARQLADAMTREYTGLVNTIADTKLIRDIATGQWFAEYTIMNKGGTMFTTPEQVQKYARALNLGEVTHAEAFGPPSEIQAKLAKGQIPKTMTEAEAAAIFEKETLSEVNRLSQQGPVVFDPNFVPKTELPSFLETRQKGAGFYMVKRQPVPINSDFARDLRIVTAEQSTPNKWLNGFSAVLGSARTPEETMALANVMNRKIATFSTALLNNVFKELHEDIKNLKSWPVGIKWKDSTGIEKYFGTSRYVKWNQWKNVMSWMENEVDPATGHKGLVDAFHTPGELRDKYVQKLRRAPDDQEIKASFAYRTQLIMGEQVEKISKYKDLIRRGGTWWKLEAVDPSFETKKELGKNVTTSFAGKKLPGLPSTGTVMIMRPEGEDTLTGSIRSQPHQFRDASKGFTQDIEKGVENGALRVVEVLEPDTYPMVGMYNSDMEFNGTPVGNLRITHVVTPNVSDSALHLDHIKVNPRSNHDYDHYVVQPRTRFNPVTGTHEYLGDHTIAAFNIRAMSAEIAGHLDNVRQLIKANKIGEAESYYQKSSLPMDWQEIKNWFLPGASAEVIGGRLSLDHRITTVPFGKLTNEVDKQFEKSFEQAGLKFADRTRETYGQVGLRDPYEGFSYIKDGLNQQGLSLSNTGSRNNPNWSVAPTRFIDPVTSINRSLVKVINDFHLNDYKTASIEHWIQEAKDLLDVKESSLKSAPAFYFHNPEAFWLSGLSGEQAVKKNNLMTSQMQIKQFLGIRDPITSFVHNTAQILADSIYTKFGEKPYMLAMADQLPQLRDPFRFIRSVTFHAKVGLFAIPQLFVQLSSIATIAGVAGWDNAASGSTAALLHTWGRINRNPAILDTLDRYASKAGFKPGQWLEARDLLERTGFEHVAGEHGFKDSTTYHDLIGGPGSTFLGLGETPFREGERGVRTAAFYAAYKEFRNTNPVRKVGERDLQDMLQRADLLTSNMSRASSSTIQSGLASLVTQFTTYTIRQAEMFMGSRLTGLERRRLFGTYALLYGVPAAAGSFSLGVGGELINTALMKSGYVSDAPDSVLGQTLAQGLPAYLTQLATGNLYNVGQRYAGGGGPISDAIWSDKSWYEILGGASGSTLYNTIVNSSGLYYAIKAAVKGEGPFSIKPDDFIDPWKEVASFNSGWKFIAALNTGKWLSTKGMTIGDASPLNALFMATTGLNYQGAAETGTIAHIKHSEKEAQAYALQKFTQEWRRGIIEFDKGNPDQGHDYWKRGFTYLRMLGYPEEDWPKAMAIASQGRESMIQRMKMDFYLKNVPQNRKEIGWEAAQKYIKAQP